MKYKIYKWITIQQIIHINSYGDCKIDFHTDLVASIEKGAVGKEVVFIGHLLGH